MVEVAHRPHRGRYAMTVVITRIPARVRFTTRDAEGWRSTRESDAPASSQPEWTSTIIRARMAVLSRASVAGDGASSLEPANTAAIATYALGLATASSSPPATVGVVASGACRGSGGARAIRTARKAM